MLENKLSELYQKIVSKVNDIIPVKWNNVILGANIDDYDNGVVYFFFDTLENKGSYIYNANISDIFNIDDNIYTNEHNELFFLVRDLQKVFIEYGQELWYMLIMNFNYKGNLEVSYEYIDWYEGGFDSGAIVNFFKAKYLGVKFESKSVLEEIERMKEYADDLEKFENTKHMLVEKVILEIKKYLGDIEYEKIVFDGVLINGVEGINFYITLKETDNKYFSFNEVVKMKNSTDEEVVILKEALYDIIDELRNLYVNNDREEWFSIMISDESEIGVDWEFTYSNWYQLKYNTEDINNYFKYVYLDIQPQDNEKKELILKMKKHEDET
ncbi:immunity protein YezG family protein [Clostridium sp. JS66]|uniref:immunity protein YezG family protein n=1 Tax=Clostridium sp. JS66 TaxID=3064705 RepID=UPI00298EC89F|nr:immunity protein YezG family protein [Clostridium sp. JS66]WPC42634.1 DUF600 family protein [Clostridium sp. JS66]